jgi:hypothetical protein
MRVRRSLVVFVLAFVACADHSPGGAATSDASPGAMSGANETPTSPVATEDALKSAREHFLTDPPAIHGIFEVHEEKELQPIRWELWVRWPALRVETIFQGNPVVVATQDGERFTVREGDQVGTSKGLGEQGAIVLSPLVQFSLAGVPVFDCPSERILGFEVAVGRPAIHVDCPEDASETWVDSASGLVLKSRSASDGPGGDTSYGYRSIEFDAELDDTLFDATTV